MITWCPASASYYESQCAGTLEIVDRAYILHDGQVLMEGVQKVVRDPMFAGLSRRPVQSLKQSSINTMAISRRLDLSRLISGDDAAAAGDQAAAFQCELAEFVEDGSARSARVITAMADARDPSKAPYRRQPMWRPTMEWVNLHVPAVETTCP